MGKLTVLYEDRNFIAVHKPAGLSVHPGKNAGVTILDLFSKQFGTQPALLHRLDRDTSGILILMHDRKSINSAIMAKLQNSISEAEKKYLTVCCGRFSCPRFRVDLPIEDSDGTKHAVTEFRVIRQFAKFTLLEAGLITGRKHQIRIHLAQRKHPVVGDKKYGDFGRNRDAAAKTGGQKLLLHAYSMQIVNSDKTKVIITDPLPGYFKDFLKCYGIVFPVREIERP